MQGTTTDIFIIGGGINGTGIAHEAASRGLSVTLCEKNDLAAGTSSTSSNLIHGGLRYLENYDFGLVRKALQEREILMRLAPHLISPLEFILPQEKHGRPAWLIRLGLLIYDHLASHPSLPNSKKVNLTNHLDGLALLSDFKIGFSYYDCRTNDARLVVLNALAAQKNGATILTHTQFLSAERTQNRWKIELKNQESTETYFCYAKALVNAAGPWIAELQDKHINIENDFSVKLVKGSHIVIPKLYEGNFAYILQNSDKRIIFTIPYENEFTLIGTTDTPYTADLDKITASTTEQTYLCNIINHYFKKSISPKDIVWSFAGVRCLQADGSQKLSDITRDYCFQFLDETGLLTVISGKLTTYRRLAEEAVKTLEPLFPQMKPSLSTSAVLPGGDIENADFDQFYQQFCAEYAWLPEKIAQRYAKSYGTRVDLFLKNVKSINELGNFFGAGLYQKEVEYLIKYEWAKSAEDILWRRTKLGLFFSEEDTKKLATWLNLFCAKQDPK